MTVGELGIDPEALARAEAALAALGGDYPTWAANDIDRLRAAVAALRRAGPGGSMEQRAEAARLVFAIAHDVKGQAATFGYPLLSRFGAALCRLTANGEAACATRAEALVAAMGLVLHGHMTDEGGEGGRALVARLQGLGIDVPTLTC